MRLRFSKISVFFIGLVLILFSTTAFSEKKDKNQWFIAKISHYECGDNCYLTVTDEKGAERVGLCAAPLCDSWNAKVAMPDSYLGKKIRFVIGTGQQFDGGGQLMGTMNAFMKIEILN